MPTVTMTSATRNAIQTALTVAKDKAIADGNAKIDAGDFVAAADCFLAANGYIVTREAFDNADDGSDPVGRLDDAMRALRQVHGALRASNVVIRLALSGKLSATGAALANRVLRLTPEEAESVYTIGFDAAMGTSMCNPLSVSGSRYYPDTTIADVCGPALDDRNLG